MKRFLVLVIAIVAVGLICSQVQAASSWFFSEGSTSTDRQMWIVVSNINTYEVSARLTFYKGDGTTVEETSTISAGSRLSLNVGTVSGLSNQQTISTKSANYIY